MSDLFSKEYLIKMYNAFGDDFEGHIINMNGGQAMIYGDGEYAIDGDETSWEIKEKIDRSVAEHFMS